MIISLSKFKQNLIDSLIGSWEISMYPLIITKSSTTFTMSSKALFNTLLAKGSNIIMTNARQGLKCYQKQIKSWIFLTE
jgi:hypothetical protein